jgi:DNA-binding NarL/FixJ family response regulator
MIEVLVADDHTLVRQGLAQLLNAEPDIRVVDQAADGEQACERAKFLRPDIVLMDIHMPRLDGIEATRRLVREHPEMSVIILTMYGDEQHLFEAVKAGAKGYVLKDADPKQLLETIRAAYRGEAWLEPTMAHKMLEEFRRLSRTELREDTVHLTTREREILELLARGASNHEIARRLGIAEKTVRNRLSLIFSKLHVNNRTQAALKARDEGWISAEE